MHDFFASAVLYKKYLHQNEFIIYKEMWYEIFSEIKNLVTSEEAIPF